MKTSVIELIKNDIALNRLQSLPIPAISVSGRSMIYNNLKDDLFLCNGRSCFTKFCREYAKIKVPKGTCQVVYVPTSQGNRFSVAFGRETDIIFLFPRFAYDLLDCVEYKRDLTYDILAYTVDKSLSSGCDCKTLSMLILERLNIYDVNVSTVELIPLIKQLVLRITRNEIFEDAESVPDLFIKRYDAYYIITVLAYTLAYCKPNSVSVFIRENKLIISIDGIDSISAQMSCDDIMVTRPFVSTGKDLIISSILAFITELFFYES